MVTAEKSHWIARLLFLFGVKYKLTHNIADKATAGYGKCDDNGFWQWELFTEI